jgi:hypothetical protein
MSLTWTACEQPKKYDIHFSRGNSASPSLFTVSNHLIPFIWPDLILTTLLSLPHMSHAHAHDTTSTHNCHRNENFAFDNFLAQLV